MAELCRTCGSAPAPGDHLRDGEDKPCWAYRKRTGSQRPESLIVRAGKRHFDEPKPNKLDSLDTDYNATAMTLEAYTESQAVEIVDCAEDYCFEQPYDGGPLCKRHSDLAMYRAITHAAAGRTDSVNP